MMFGAVGAVALRCLGLFKNDVIIFGRYPRFSLQTTHVLRVHCILLIHGWSEVKPDENDHVIYELSLFENWVV